MANIYWFIFLYSFTELSLYERAYFTTLLLWCQYHCFDYMWAQYHFILSDYFGFICFSLLLVLLACDLIHSSNTDMIYFLYFLLNRLDRFSLSCRILIGIWTFSILFNCNSHHICGCSGPWWHIWIHHVVWLIWFALDMVEIQLQPFMLLGEDLQIVRSNGQKEMYFTALFLVLKDLGSLLCWIHF